MLRLGACDSNSGPPVCTARTLTEHHFPQTHNQIFKPLRQGTRQMPWRLPVWHTLRFSGRPGGAGDRPATGSHYGVSKAQGCAHKSVGLLPTVPGGRRLRWGERMLTGLPESHWDSLTFDLPHPCWSVLCPQSPSPRFLSQESSV